MGTKSRERIYGSSIRAAAEQAAAARKEADRLACEAWGMPPPPRTGGPPVTNIRNTNSPHWRGWLKPENRCLVPFNSFAEYTPEPNPDTKKRDVVWFALGDHRPLTAFAGFRNYYRFYFIQPFSLQNSKPVASISS
jgi:putative SOS response-associated peptidase YedK